MKSILTVAALLGALAAPAQAEETAPSQSGPVARPVVVAPVAGAAQPAALPQSSAVQVVPLSSAAPHQGEAMGKAGGSGCGRQTTVYLTN